MEANLKCESCSSTYEWQCGFDCIIKEETCNGTCANEFVYCPEYSKCIESTSPCQDKCLSVKYPKLKTKHKSRQFLEQLIFFFIFKAAPSVAVMPSKDLFAQKP